MSIGAESSSALQQMYLWILNCASLASIVDIQGVNVSGYVFAQGCSPSARGKATTAQAKSLKNRTWTFLRVALVYTGKAPNS